MIRIARAIQLMLCAVGGAIAGLGIVTATDPIIEKLERRQMSSDSFRYQPAPAVDMQARLDDIESELAADDAS